MSNEIPTIIVTRYRDQFTFMCPACGKRHYHGAIEGRREPHCRDHCAFPNGYILKLEANPAPAEGGYDD